MPTALAALLAEEEALEKRLAIERARRGLLNFTRYTSPEGYDINHHHRTLARYLNLVVSGDCSRLMVCMPPRHGKSRMVSIEFPSFLLGVKPHSHMLAASYNATLAAKMNRSVQRKIDSPLYRDVFPGTTLNGKNIRSVASGSWLRNTDEFEVVGTGGFYRSTGVGGSATGYGASVGIIDDPVKNKAEAGSQTYRDKVWDWYTSTFYTRLEKHGAMVVCATRWHEDELMGRLLAQAKADPNADQWVVLNMPAIAEHGPTELDPRQPGEALWPGKYPLEKLTAIKAITGESVWQALYQQRPAPAEGAIVKREWWRFYRDRPEKFDEVCISADLTFEDKAKNDFAVYLVIGRVKASYYVIGMTRARMEFVQQKRTLRMLLQRYPEVSRIYVEKAANGYALISDMRGDVNGLIPVKPLGSKVARLEAITPLIEAGNVYLPDPKEPNSAWAQLVIEETAAFPNGANDDICDALSQGLSEMRKRRGYTGVRATDIPKLGGISANF